MSGSGSLRRFADLAAAIAIIAVVAAVGVWLRVWTGFPKGTDAYAHLTRLQFVADWFPRHDWLYGWSAGMPTFETYPELPYLAAAPVTKVFGAPAALDALAFMGLVLLGLGLFGAVRVATGSFAGGIVAALGAVASMATWTWIFNGGVYARIVGAGLGACACCAAAVWIQRGGRGAFAATALLLAAAIASHQFVGAVFAVGIGIATLAYKRPSPVARAASLAVLTALFASPAVVPTFFRYGGFTNAFLGLERPQLPSPTTVLVDPLHVGFAVLPVLMLAIASAGRPSRGTILAVGAVAVWVLYLFAPNLGLPSRLYYVNGVDPFSTTFFVAVVGALAAGAVLGVAAGRRPRLPMAVLAVLAVGLIALNAWVGVTGILASPGYPKIEDTGAPNSIEVLAQRTLEIDGRDLTHRYLPATAYESVWFSYVYAKPQLRDYYAQGVLHPDWLAWANAAVYTPPFVSDRFHAALDWFAIDGFTVEHGPNFTGNLPELERDPSVRLIRTSEEQVFREYAVLGATTICRATNARLLVVVGGREEYDTIARLALDRLARPNSLIPIWWSGTADSLPGELLERAQAIVIESGRLGDDERAARLLEPAARQGTRLVFDAASGPAATLSGLWPVATYAPQAIAAWRLEADPSVTRVSDFADPSYDGGPWNAPVGASLRPDARAILTQDGQPLVAVRSVGNGAAFWVGGNLYYHAKSKASAVETAFLLGLFGPSSGAAPAIAEMRWLDPERTDVRISGGSGVFVSESFHPKWTARWSDGTTLGVYYAGPGLVYVPTPRGDGVVTLELQHSWADVLVWIPPFAGVGVLVRPWRRRR
ncbi:MAG TPA: hypothetical protein VGQ86_01385 [Candidatus Limnocylindria bacterium]|nr:hypothetical protein [Candidatus Limnocylindria bacterium]